jgi:hypothetical protein
MNQSQFHKNVKRKELPMCGESIHDFIELLETKNSLKLKKNPSKTIFQLFIELLFLPVNAYTHNCFYGN